MDELEKGTPQGVSIGSDGKLRAGWTASEVITTPSSFVWSVVSDKTGTIYVATGSPATVLRVNPDKSAKPRFTKLFESKALAVQSMILGPDGNLYAATIPDGKVYRLKPDATKPLDELSAEVVLDLGKPDTLKPESVKLSATDPALAGATEGKSREDEGEEKKSEGKPESKPEAKPHYIWDMTLDGAGRLYVATGGPGIVYRLNVRENQPRPEVFFQSDEQHIRVLTWDKAGNLLAGTDGSGLVYRISPQGKGYVLFSAPRREITALAVGGNGTIFEADAGDKSRNPLPPLPVQSGNSGITISFVQPGSMQAANASAALPEGSEVYELRPDQAPHKLWADKDDIVYKLVAAEDGLTALTGNRGRLFSIHSDGSYNDIAHLDAQQAVTIATTDHGWLVGTANTGRLYSIGSRTSDRVYASDVLDAGALARWGRIEVDPGSNGYKFYTRSGNVEQPARSQKDWGWSDWQLATDGKAGSPPGRFLQWKVAMEGEGVVGGVGVNYLPVNAAPVVDEVLVVPGARVAPTPAATGQAPTVSIAFPTPSSNATMVFDNGNAAGNAPVQAQKDRTAATVRWSAHDDNGDDLTFDLLLRGDGETVWRPFKKGLTERIYSFDAASLPDGGYQIKVVASDSPVHTPGDALMGEMISDRFELDTTPPVINGLRAGMVTTGNCRKSPCALALPIQFEAKDAASTISHAEISIDAGPWQYIEPVGGLSDEKEEHYSVSISIPDVADARIAELKPADQEHLITVRVYDRHENMATARLVVPGSNVQK